MPHTAPQSYEKKLKLDQPMPGMIPLLTADPFSIEMEGWPQSLLRPNSSEWGPKSLTNSIRSHSCNFCSRKPTTTHTFPFLVPHGTPKASKWCWQRPMNKINTHYWLVPFLSSTYKNKMAILRFLSPNWFGSREALWRRTVSNGDAPPWETKLMGGCSLVSAVFI